MITDTFWIYTFSSFQFLFENVLVDSFNSPLLVSRQHSPILILTYPILLFHLVSLVSPSLLFNFWRISCFPVNEPKPKRLKRVSSLIAIHTSNTILSQVLQTAAPVSGRPPGRQRNADEPTTAEYSGVLLRVSTPSNWFFRKCNFEAN